MLLVSGVRYFPGATAACLGRVKDGTAEYMLVPLDGEGYPLSEGQTMLARLREYSFAGVFGYKSGFADAKNEPGPDAWRVMCAATPEFLTLLAQKLAPQSDGVDWLEKLHQLPDTREN